MNQIIALGGAAAGGHSASRMPTAADFGDAPIAVEIRQLRDCSEIRQAWADLAARALEPNLFFEPDFALAAAQHLIAFRDVAVLLAWQGPPGHPRRRLVGLLPCFARKGLFVPDQLIGLADERIGYGAPLLDAVQAEAVLVAILRQRQGWALEGRGLLLRRLDLDGALVARILRAAEALGLSATLQPARILSAAAIDQSRPGPASAQLQGKLTVTETSAPGALRDAVEHILAMEASGPRGRAGTAVLQDTREVGFLRAMTRGLARSRQCRVGLLMRDGRPIAGAILLGRAPRAWLHLAAHDEAHVALAPERRLIAMMARAVPARIIVEPDQAAFGEIRLSPQAVPRPRDLAGRAREALRHGFRLPRAGAA